ncbi:unnamed protein product [Peniophora sp. CBMAI 1063]|nr:unnamed protein product [Peniophora sp. CBMAI 1063]
MSREASTISEEVSSHSSRRWTNFMDLPNELLVIIIDFVGPPDLSCCDPGWLVVPAVCRRLKEAASKVPEWESGVPVMGGRYGWHTLTRYSKIGMPANTPDRGIFIRDQSHNRTLHCYPVYKDGSVTYPEARYSYRASSLEWKSGEDALRAVNQHFDGLPLHGRRSLNLTWITDLSISFRGDFPNALASHSDSPLDRLPCIVAPALRELYLNRYVADWQAPHLKRLRIEMDNPLYQEASINYRYSPTRLLLQLHESRLTLESVHLRHCLLAASEDDHPEGSRRDPVRLFPLLKDFEITETLDMTNWLCCRIGFPPGNPPIVNGPYGSAINVLRSLACAYARSAPYPKPAHSGFHGELDALTFRESNEHEGVGCLVTGSRVTGLDRPWRSQVPDHNLQEYALGCIARYIDFDEEQDARQLERKVSGIEPVFIADLPWSAEDWSAPPSPHDGTCGNQCTALHGVKYVFFNGMKGRVIKNESDVEVWTSVLRNLPSVHTLYLYAPTPAALQPLIDEPNLLPNLRTLWLGRDNCSKGDGDREGYEYGDPGWYGYNSLDEEDSSDSSSDSEADNDREGESDEQRIAGLSPKRRVRPPKGKVDAGLMLNILRRRNLVLAFVNMEVVGDPRDVETLNGLLYESD